MTAQELKNSILQRAIEGRLVEQRAEEGSGEALYKLIQKEKKKLIKIRTLKKQKALPEIKEDEIPFEIPKTWKWVRLGELTLKITDGAHSTPTYTKEGVPFLSVKDISSGKIDYSDCKFISQEEHEKLFERCNPEKGDLLLTKVGTTGIPVVVETEDEFSLFVSVALLKFPNKLIDIYFLKHLINSPLVQVQAKENTRGVGNKNWVMRDIATTIIPLPPLAEQKKIVEKLEKLMPLIERYDEIWQRLEDLDKRFPETLKKSLLQEAIKGRLVEQKAEEGTGEELYKLIQKEKKKLIKIGTLKKQKALPEIKEDEIPFEIPKTWKWVRLGEIGEWRAGSTPSRSNPKFYGGNIPWLKTGDLNDGYITDVPEYITDLALNSTSLKLNPENSVLIAMYGATIGKLGILTKPMTTNQACCAYQPMDGIYNLYLFYFLMASRRRIIKMAEGGAQPNISRTKIISITIPLPPLAEQKRIVEKLEELMPLCEQLTRKTK